MINVSIISYGGSTVVTVKDGTRRVELAGIHPWRTLLRAVLVLKLKKDLPVEKRRAHSVGRVRANG